ncbi:MAG: hypothetical protein HYX25_08260 [Candidatus Solibacter usitatus]|nr:hypothetical protein [Candidatus Solibacter usitatus]
MKTFAALISAALLFPAAPPDPARARAKCSGFTQPGDWPNPFIVVAAAGVTVISGSHERREMAVEQLASFLKKLPKSAWPCGRVAALQQAGPRGLHDDAPIAGNLRKVKQILKKLAVRMDPWPSA